MKTIKIIDLLNKICNDEEVPKKVKYCGCIYKYQDIEGEKDIYTYATGGKFKIYLFSICDNLNDEVEIIEPEEDNKIGKIIPTSLKGIDNLDEKIEVAHLDTISATDKLNELIDEVNKLKEGK